MKLSQRQIDDLLVLISHARIDMNYGSDGSYNIPSNKGNGDYKFDEKDAKKTLRAIDYVKKFIFEKNGKAS